MKRNSICSCLLSTLLLCLSGCDNDRALNNPHTDYDDTSNVRFAVFSESPKTLDPARSYSSNEARFTSQIVEPLLQYDYLARPYRLTPLTATAMPTITTLDKRGRPIEPDSGLVAYTVYDIHLKPDIYYQPHPAFAKTENNQFRYFPLPESEQDKIDSLQDFFYTDTRTLTAEDYAYQIKRLADPRVRSPIFGLMSEHIVGLKQLNQQIAKLSEDDADAYIDLRTLPLEGVTVLSDTHLQIKIQGQYAQFIYWLAMSFFAPTPWEVDRFYQQAILKDKNISFDWAPMGTGPYQLVENNPNSRMVLQKNPNFRGEHLKQPGKPFTPLPQIDKHVFVLEKESIPQWTKFIQGYYDTSSISADSFDQAIQITSKGEPQLTNALADRGIQLYTTIEPAIYYIGFNYLDDIVGGHSDTARNLRQAITLAIDYEEYITIFLNGRGLPAIGPIPPGIFGYDEQQHTATPEQNLLRAKKLMAKAGYKNGIDPKTRQPLILNYDVPASNGPEEKAILSWMRKQFAKLGIQLHVRSTQYNRFQEKMRAGNAQIYAWGWLADYPDPENFLFLFYGPNGKVKHGGENASNYANAEYDRLFEKMRDMPNTPERQEIIQKMVSILQQDMPWIWGYHPKQFTLTHAWVSPMKRHAFANNTMKYFAINPAQRKVMRNAWNRPVRWPAIVLLLFVFSLLLPLVWQYQQRGRTPTVKRHDEESR